MLILRIIKTLTFRYKVFDLKSLDLGYGTNTSIIIEHQI